MSPSLKETRAVAALAKLLYPYLPGSGSRQWRGHVTFASVAQEVGVGEFWRGGSKEPAINALLSGVLTHRRGRFEPLLLAIVRAGMLYRQKNGPPITADEVRQMNGLIVDVGFKFPALWDPEFLASLDVDQETRARTHVEREAAEAEVRASARQERTRELQKLQQELYQLYAESDRQAAGLALERLLNRVFQLFDLAPRKPFRVEGEQIDGSFELHHEIYLLEAKWEKKPLAEEALLVFRGKIEGKSTVTRGVFVSLSGVSQEAKNAIRVGKQPSFFIMDGHDLNMVLGEQLALGEFLERRQRLLAEEGAVCVPFSELMVRS